MSGGEISWNLAALEFAVLEFHSFIALLPHSGIQGGAVGGLIQKPA